eukprot:TRINITY_DN5109_c1_g1_i1.p1 TRINITY_DN5109_c1_g1~~TRINITY_DN5109_c1_g1_i1.p1  ORF type:complete len:157 (+),score=28.87 TRINITY_DN5109_c1_g1_i1:133-603(+)
MKLKGFSNVGEGQFLQAKYIHGSRMFGRVITGNSNDGSEWKLEEVPGKPSVYKVLLHDDPTQLGLNEGKYGLAHHVGSETSGYAIVHRDGKSKTHPGRELIDQWELQPMLNFPAFRMKKVLGTGYPGGENNFLAITEIGRVTFHLQADEWLFLPRG